MRWDEALAAQLVIHHIHPPLAGIISMFVVSGVVTAFISINVMALVWLERKISGLIQNRMGPMMIGFIQPRRLATSRRGYFRWISVWFGGWLQTLADGLKLLLKEDIIPTQADKWVFIIAPVVIFTASLMNYALIPFSSGFPVVQNFDIGFLYIFALGSYTAISILMAGWSSNNKYSLLGGMRAAAQIITYEIPLVLSLIGIVMITGTLNMENIVHWQQFSGTHRGHWLILYQPVAFLIFIIAAVAETNRAPFDMPEAESELVAGFNTEYSGFRFALFFLSEYANMFMSCGLAATVFLGGWSGPGSENAFIAFLWFLAKTYSLVLLFMWIRWTFPRLRIDQLMEFGWKFLTPLALLNLIWTGLEIWLRQTYRLPHAYWLIWVPLAAFALVVSLKKRVNHPLSA